MTRKKERDAVDDDLPPLPQIRPRRPSSSSSFVAARQAMLEQCAAALMSPVSMLGGGLGGLVEEAPPKPPSVDAGKLEALKNSEPYKVMARIPDLMECITAWRAWRVVGMGSDLRLQALGTSHVWQPRQAIDAVCDDGTPPGFRILLPSTTPKPKSHLAPCWNCNCGVWAFKELDSLVSAVRKYDAVSVLGNVSLWGRVIETENGFRAEHAYPKELWLFRPEHEELGLTYDVPVRLVR